MPCHAPVSYTSGMFGHEKWHSVVRQADLTIRLRLKTHSAISSFNSNYTRSEGNSTSMGNTVSMLYTNEKRIAPVDVRIEVW